MEDDVLALLYHNLRYLLVLYIESISHSLFTYWVHAKFMLKIKVECVHVNIKVKIISGTLTFPGRYLWHTDCYSSQLKARLAHELVNSTQKTGFNQVCLWGSSTNYFTTLVPSIHLNHLSFRGRGGWSQPQMTLGERRGKPWKGLQQITGPANRDKQQITLKFTPTVKYGSK